jgi:ZIP family zinc transporter
MFPLLLAFVTSAATSAGGTLALKVRDRFHLVLGLAAGLMLGLVAFDLNPEIYSHLSIMWGKLPAAPVAFAVGFLLLHIVEKWFGTHEHEDSHYDEEHTHFGAATGVFGALAMAGHVFMDGVAIGVSYKVSHALGYAVFGALMVHAFSDGLNTVAMLVRAGKWNRGAIGLLLVDAATRIAGAAVGNAFHLSEGWIAVYLAFFSGFVIYIATSHILPEAHARHHSRATLAATAGGVILMWLVVATLG